MTPVAIRPASRSTRFVKRHQLAIFVVLTMIVSWAFIPVADGGLLPHGPMLAAFAVLALTSGRRGIAGIWRRMRVWRVGWRWYLIAPGLFVAMHAVALALASAVGLEVAAPSAVWTLSGLLVTGVTLVFLGGQWEEPGWLGYLLRRLSGLHPLLMLLVAGLVRMVWHTPLVLQGTIPWFNCVFVSLALQVILTWLYTRTGSLLIPMLAHLFANLTMAVCRPLVAEPQLDRYLLVLVVVEVAVAVVILIATRGRMAPCPR